MTRSDRELLAAHVAGDHDAFGELFARHRDRLWAVALRTTGHPEDAADALQDGLISAYRRAGSFRGDAAVTTWLHRVIVNACLDRMRAARVRAADALPDDLEEYAGRAHLRGPHAVEAGVDDDPVQPGGDRGVAAEAPGPAVRRDQCVLQCVCGVLGVPGGAQRDRPQPVTVPGEQLPERVVVTGDVRGQQLLVGPGHRAAFMRGRRPRRPGP